MKNVRKFSKRYNFRQIATLFLACCMFFGTSLRVAQAGPSDIKVKVPKVKVKVPKIKIPKIKVPKVKVPKIKVPKVKGTVLSNVISTAGNNVTLKGKATKPSGHGVDGVGAKGKGAITSVKCGKISNQKSQNLSSKSKGGVNNDTVTNTGEGSAKPCKRKTPKGYYSVDADNEVFLVKAGSDVIVKINPLAATKSGGKDVSNSVKGHSSGKSLVLAAGDAWSRAISFDTIEDGDLSQGSYGTSLIIEDVEITALTHITPDSSITGTLYLDEKNGLGVKNLKLGGSKGISGGGGDQDEAIIFNFNTDDILPASILIGFNDYNPAKDEPVINLSLSTGDDFMFTADHQNWADAITYVGSSSVEIDLGVLLGPLDNAFATSLSVMETAGHIYVDNIEYSKKPIPEPFIPPEPMIIKKPISELPPESMIIRAAPLVQFQIPTIEGCSLLMQAAAMELGIVGKTINVGIGNVLALNPNIQPCQACATLIGAAIILRDEDGSRMAAMNEVFNELAPADAPFTPEMATSIVMAFEGAAEGTQYASVMEYIDAFVQYVAVLDTDLGSPVGNSVAFVIEKYGAGITGSDNGNIGAFVATRLEGLETFGG